MCLIISIKHHKKINGSYKPKTAKKDLYCLKAVMDYDPESGRCLSYFKMRFQWKGILMKSSLSNPCMSSIDIGLHAYRLHEPTYNWIDDHRDTIMLAKIPKGSKYYVGFAGEIVSDTMVLVEPIVTNGSFLPDNVNPVCLEVKDMVKIANKILKGYGYEKQGY